MDEKDIQRAVEADKLGFCVLCALENSFPKRATQRAYNGDKYLNVCNWHAEVINQIKAQNRRNKK